MRYFNSILLIFLLSPLVSQATPANIGVILPLTGEASALGEACSNGFKLAQEDNIDREIVSFKFENDEMIARNTLSSYRKLQNQGGLSAIITMAAGPSNVIAPIAQAEGVPMVGITNDSSILSGRDKVFLFWLPAEEQAKAMFKEAYARGYRKIARINTVHQGMLLVKKSFNYANQDRIKIVYDEDVVPEMHDFRTVIEKLRREGPIDAIFVNLFIGQAGMFARQVRELGLQYPFFNGVIFENASEVTASNGALFGQWYVQVDEATDKFLNRYSARFPGASSFMAGNCYDVATLMIQARRANHSVDKYLKSVKNYEGATGLIEVNSSNAFVLPATVKVVTETGFKRIGFTEGQER